MGSEATFTRRTTGPDTVTYSVTPATRTRTWVITCTLLFFGASLIFWVVFGFLFGMWVGLLLALAVSGVLVWRYLNRMDRLVEVHRKPVELMVGPRGLTREGKLYPLSDIAEFEIRSGTGEPNESPVVQSGGSTIFVGSPVVFAGMRLIEGSNKLGAQVGSALASRLTDRAFVLVVRMRGTTGVEVVSGGLTLKCAQTLMSDLIDELSAYIPR